MHRLTNNGELRWRQPLVACMLMLLISMLPWSCAKDEFKKSGDKEKGASATPPKESDAKKPATPFALVVYQMDVKANTGLQLCTGVARFTMYDNFDLKPSGSLNCLLTGNIPLTQLFGEPDGVVYRDEDMSQYKDFGRIQRKQNPAQLVADTAIFTPPRPGFIGPIIQRPEEYADYVFKEPSQVQGMTREGQPYQANGEWFVQVHEVNTELHPEGYTGPLEFKSVIRWEVKGVGFAGAPRANFMAFDSMMYYFNVKPQLSIPKIEIKTKLSEVAGSLGGAAGGGIMGGLGDMLFSGITITLNLREHTPL